MEKMEKNCKDCQHVFEVDGEFICRRFPPSTSSEIYKAYSFFPLVKYDWVCGEFKSKKMVVDGGHFPRF